MSTVNETQKYLIYKRYTSDVQKHQYQCNKTHIMRNQRDNRKNDMSKVTIELFPQLRKGFRIQNSSIVKGNQKYQNKAIETVGKTENLKIFQRKRGYLQREENLRELIYKILGNLLDFPLEKLILEKGQHRSDFKSGKLKPYEKINY